MRRKKSYYNSTEGTIQAGAYKVLEEIHEGIKNFKKLHPKAHVIIQGDFNTFPEYFEDNRANAGIKNLNIFNYLTNQAYSLFRSHKPTELNQAAKTLKKRELDYIVTSQTLKDRVEVYSPEDQELSLAKVDDESVHFDPMLLFSDHRPIWAKIKRSKK